jgi:hypothetical protein
MYGDGQATTDAAKAKELSSQFYGNSLMPERAQAGMDQLLKTGLVDEGKLLPSVFVLAARPRSNLSSIPAQFTHSRIRMPTKTGVKGLGYNAEAASRSWSQMQLFFDEIFGAAS